MVKVTVTPIQYRVKGDDKYHYGLRIHNNKTNTSKFIDRNLNTLNVKDFDWCVRTESKGNIIFDL